MTSQLATQMSPLAGEGGSKWRIAPRPSLDGSSSPRPSPARRSACCPPPPETAPPNILLILVDDLGIDQLSVYDDQNDYAQPYPYANTPNINRLAAEGIRFTQARANPLCSPSRAALQGGMYSFDNGVGDLIFGPNQGVSCISDGFVDFLPSVSLATPLADVVRERPNYEYYSFLIGKSHLAIDSFLEPTDPNLWCGGNADPNCLSLYGWSYITNVLHYDYFEGVMRGLANHPHPDSHKHDVGDPCPRGTNRFREFFWIIDPNVGNPPPPPLRYEVQGVYYTAYEADRMIDFLDAAPKPFLAVWSTVDPHAPFEWPPNQHGGLPYHGFGENNPGDPAVRGSYINTTFRAKLEYLDSTIGRVLDSMTQTDRDNLTIIFVGDNGTQNAVMMPSAGEVSYPVGHPLEPGWTGPAFVSTVPYDPNRMKGTVSEGGIRVPLIVSSGALIDPALEGTVSDQMVDIVDLYETIREISYTGGAYPAPPQDSKSLSFAWVLRNESGPVYYGRREYSYSGTFSPNTTFPIDLVNYPNYPNGSWLVESQKQYWNDCYIRYEPGLSPPSTEHYYKIIRGVSYAGGAATVGYQFYDLDFSGNGHPEHVIYTQAHPEFAATLGGLESKSKIQENEF